MGARIRILPYLLFALVATPLIGADNDEATKSIPPIDKAEFAELHAQVKPCEGESPWREIAWVTNITEARRRAIAEDKPLVIFTAADGSPLGRT